MVIQGSEKEEDDSFSFNRFSQESTPTRDRTRRGAGTEVRTLKRGKYRSMPSIHEGRNVVYRDSAHSSFSRSPSKVRLEESKVPANISEYSSLPKRARLPQLTTKT